MAVTDILSGGAADSVRDADMAPGPDVVPATLPAWAVVFCEDIPAAKTLLAVGSETYDGSVAATLPRDLGGGSYEIVVEGLTDEDYKLIRLPAGRHLAATLHLWWKDSPAGVLGDLARVTGLSDSLGAVTPAPPAHSLVADIRVDTVRRRAGERRYETVVTGRERVVARLRQSHVEGLCYASLTAAANAVASSAGIEVITHGLDALTPPEDERDFADVRPGTGLDAMTTVAAQARAALGREGLPPAVIRDGILHVGLWTAADAGVRALGVRRSLDESRGLVSVLRGNDPEAPADPDPDPGLGSGPARPAPPARATVTATALGRPDIKPGDTVAIPLPPEDFPVLAPSGSGLPILSELADLLGAKADAPTASPCLVTDVTHRLSRRQGFVTTVRALVLRSTTDDGWDVRQPGRQDAQEDRASPLRGSVAADHATSAAGAVKGVARAVLQRAPGLRMRPGEVRGHAGTAAEKVTTSEVWYAAADGPTGGVQQVEITPDRHGELQRIPVVTPFAVGGYGLVLPRYPGTRVLLADAGGGGRDVLDVGAVWGAGAQPPAEPGDWWLVLPLGLATDDLPPDQQPVIPDDEASHDLIDGDGRRLIETAGFVVRVTDAPTHCDQRPDAASAAGTVVIENKKGDTTARIVLTDDGSITITGTAITLDTAGKGDITLKAKNVNVSVSGTMDVS